jgi:hypothetical protein
MKHRLALMGASAVLGGLLSACGGGDEGGDGLAMNGSGGGSGNSTAPPPAVATTAAMPSPQDTAGVLATARQSSETEDAFGVNNGAFTFTDTSDKTEPMAVNGT